MVGRWLAVPCHQAWLSNYLGKPNPLRSFDFGQQVIRTLSCQQIIGKSGLAWNPKKSGKQIRQADSIQGNNNDVQLDLFHAADVQGVDYLDPSNTLRAT